MASPRATQALLQRSIEAIEASSDTFEELPEALRDLLMALQELLESPGALSGPAANDARQVLEMVALAGESELRNQQSVTATLEALSLELERRILAAPVALAAGQACPPCGIDGGTKAGRSLGLLAALLSHNPSRLAPELDPTSPLGHRYPFADEKLAMEPGDTIRALEELSDLGLFQRTLVNRIHVCSECERCHLNFREQCPRCDSIDLKVERVLHHFRCGYTGIESEFGSGIELACPKCRRELFQLGQDFDRPHETYVCRHCESLFEEPQIGAQCLACSKESAGHEAPQRAIYTYSPTPLANRAVELGRLTGLEVDSILYDAELKIATRDFLEFEIKRELVRLSRHATAFSTATVSFERHGRTVPIFRDWTASTLRELCVMLAGSLRSLDLVTRLDASRLGILMPEADEAGAAIVRRRLFAELNEMSFVDRSGNDLVPTWTVATWAERRQPIEEVRRFLFPDSNMLKVEP